MSASLLSVSFLRRRRSSEESEELEEAVWTVYCLDATRQDKDGREIVDHSCDCEADQQARCTPIYEEMPGWSESTEGARSWADLPANAIKYVRRVEELIQCPVALLSTSPERDDTILVTDPFAD